MKQFIFQDNLKDGVRLLLFSLVLVFFVSIDQSYAQTYSANLSLDPIPSQIKSGDEIIFSGRLITLDGKYVIPDRTIYIKDDVDFGSDTILGSVITDANGEFSASWTAVSRDSGSYDFYAVFDGDDYVQKARSKTFSVYVNEGSNLNNSGSSSSNSDTNQQYPNYYEIQITLDKIQSSIFAGESITFTGKLSSNGNPVSNVIVQIMEDDPLSSDQLLSAGRTDSSGRFSISWQANKGLVETDFDIYAVFDGDSNYLRARSPNQILSVLRHTGSITLDTIPKSANIGDRITFSGTLKLNQGSSEGAIVYIKDEDPASGDDLLVTAFVDRNGMFSANWLVTDVDADGTADVYAVFEGNDVFYRLTTCDYGITSDFGGSCSNTIPLTIYYSEISSQPAQPKPDPSSNEYIKLFYALDFSKTPKVAIVPDPDSYNEAARYIVPVQEGILMWKSYLDGTYGGNWNVDFDIVSSDDLFVTSNPDVVVNLITPEMDSRCFTDFYGYTEIYQNPIKPIQAYVCVTANGKSQSNTQVITTSGHEFIHAVGLGHTWNKQGDMMCSAEEINGQWIYTCPNYVLGKSETPSTLNLAGVVKLYGDDGFKNPNNKVTYGTKVSLDNNLEPKQYPSVTQEIDQNSFDITEETYKKIQIPNWIKVNAKWWAEEKITDVDFVQGIEHLIKQGMIRISETSSSSGSSQEIPTWIKNMAGWWADGLVSDEEFVKGIEYLVKEGIIRIN